MSTPRTECVAYLDESRQTFIRYEKMKAHAEHLETELGELTDDVRPLLHRMQSILADNDEYETFRERMEEFIIAYPQFRL